MPARTAILPEELTESLGADWESEGVDPERTRRALHLRRNAGRAEEKNRYSLLVKRSEGFLGVLPMIAIDHELGAGEVRARVGGGFAARRIDRLMSAKLYKQTQQRGYNFFPRKNQYRGHDRSNGDTSFLSGNLWTPRLVNEALTRD